MRQNVKGNLVRVHLFGDRASVDDLLDLPLEFFNGFSASPRHRLITGGENALYRKGLMKRIKSHQGHGRGAIRIGNDALVPFHVRGINLRNHERYLVIHPEGARVIDDDAAAFCRQGRELLRNAASGAK